jgi:mannose-6-phosphate isomerase-like protein (cupin superfamily)
MGGVTSYTCIPPITFSKPELHPKQWGCEEWITNNEQYCAKILRFCAGTRFSNHYHWRKTEHWYVVVGRLKLIYFDLSNADRLEREIGEGEVISVPAGNPHQLIALEDSVVWEVSTTHDERDSYRIEKGDSQKQT